MLGVTEDEAESASDNMHQAEWIAYHYLGGLQSELIDILSEELPDPVPGADDQVPDDHWGEPPGGPALGRHATTGRPVSRGSGAAPPARHHGIGRDGADDGEGPPAAARAAGSAPGPAFLLDTPFGFQENAHEIAGRAVTYFRESLRAPIAVSGTVAAASGEPARESGPDAFAAERLVATVRDSRYVFAGPGSPSYALRKWQGTAIPSLLVEKLLHGGCVVFASAAALTLGVATVPVYEIYKCGEDPHWLEGLDVASAAGMPGGDHPPLRQQRGWDPRHPFLLPG